MLSCLRSTAKKVAAALRVNVIFLFVDLALFKVQSGYFCDTSLETLLSFVYGWCLFPFPVFPARNIPTKPIITYSINQPTSRPIDRHQPKWPQGSDLNCYLIKSGIQGSNLCVIIYILIEPTLIFAISYIAFLYSFDLFCWFFFINDYIWAAKFPSN